MNLLMSRKSMSSSHYLGMDVGVTTAIGEGLIM
jgi:hypothetical protein